MDWNPVDAKRKNTWWLGVPQLTLKEHHDARIKKARNA